MSSSRKKAIIRKYSRDWLAGYLPVAGFSNGGQLEILDLDGKVTRMNLEEVKWVCFVRDFNSGEPTNPERLLRKTFAGRPRGEGIWLRLRLKDNEQLEGIAANDLSLLENEGIFLTPPDTRSNTQRIFLPRTSVAEMEVIAVISASGKRKSIGPELQESLFSPRES